jgi:trimeric autotransporter adhesin
MVARDTADSARCYESVFTVVASKLLALPCARISLAAAFCSIGALFAFAGLKTPSAPLLPGTITTFTGDGGSSGRATNTAIAPLGGVVRDGYLYIADARWNVVRRIDLFSGQQIVIAGNGLAGNGVEAYNGDNIPATQAQLRSPSDVAIDSAGNLYIADFGNHRVRKVDKLDGTGTITTVVGIGQPGYNGDGIPASLAQVACPEGVDVDTAGNLYVADTGNHRIRKITAGTIATVAGTGIGTALCLNVPTQEGGYNGDNIPASAAQLNAPVAINHDASGNLYIADFYNHRIRRVDSAGTITTYAGNGMGGYNGDGMPATSTQIYNPGGMDLDASGNLFFADVANHRVRKIDTTSQHIITTVAGNGIKGVSEDGGLAINSTLVFPWSAAVDPAGNVYISDTSDYPASGYILSRRVRKVDMAGVISTVAGNRYEFYGGDGGIAQAGQFNEIIGVGIGAGINIYVTNDMPLEPNNQRVRRVDFVGNLSTFAGTGVPGFNGDNGPAITAQLQDPVGIVGDVFGNVFIADSTNNRIRKVDRFGTISTYAGTGASGFSGDAGPAMAATLRLPEGVALDRAGDLYVADSANYRIRKINAAEPHIISTVAGNGTFGNGGDNGPATSAQIGFVHSITVDAAGNLYVADRNNNKIRKIDGSGTISTVAGNGAFCGNTPCPTGDGGPAIAAQLNSPEGVALDAAGNLYIADGFNNRVRKIAAGANGTIDPTDIITTVVGTGDKAYGGDGGAATAAQLNFPQDVALDGLGNLYIADFANRRVRRVEKVGPTMLQTVVSRKTHGSAGTFDVDLPLTGSPGIECRSGGANGDYTMVFSFVNALTGAGGATVTSGNGSVSSAKIDSSNAHNYIVNLTGVTNAQTINVTLNNMTDSAGNSGSAVSARMGVLLGDVNASGVVTSGDTNLCKAQALQPVTSANFRNDVNASGAITTGDVNIIKQNALSHL